MSNRRSPGRNKVQARTRASRAKLLRNLAYVVASAVVVVAVVLGIGLASRRGSGGEQMAGTSGSPQKAVALPAFVSSAPGIVREAYVYAVEHPEVLKHMACYCGCGGHDGHRNNEDCFVDSRNPDGSITFDRHGAECDVCVYIALDAKKLVAQGKPLTEVRKQIDARYGRNGPSTNTPYPPASLALP